MSIPSETIAAEPVVFSAYPNRHKEAEKEPSHLQSQKPALCLEHAAHEGSVSATIALALLLIGLATD